MCVLNLCVVSVYVYVAHTYRAELAGELVVGSKNVDFEVIYALLQAVVVVVE